MAAAVARPCAVCETASSKYKCPSCSSPTCSLACSKAHKAEKHGAVASTSASTAGHSREGSGLSASDLRSKSNGAPQNGIKANGQEIRPPPSGFTATTSYVPLSSYDDRQLLKDFEYLQHVGRSVQEVGRDLTKQHWFSPDMVTGETTSSQQQRHDGNGGRGNTHTAHQQLSVAQKRRQALEATIRRGRWPIMLLPEGMQMRRENRTQWRHNKMAFTVEMKGNSSSSSSLKAQSEDNKRSRILLHQIDGQESVHHLVMDQLVKRTKNLLPKKLRKTETRSEARYLISDAAWYQAGVSPPDSFMSKQKGAEKGFRDEDGSREPKPYNELPPWCEIVVAVHSDRLRNESSAKFLGWWKRQVKNGLVGPDGLELLSEKHSRRDETGEDGQREAESVVLENAMVNSNASSTDGANGGNGFAPASRQSGIFPDPGSLTSVPAGGLAGLLSSDLLSRLHEQMKRGNDQQGEMLSTNTSTGEAKEQSAQEKVQEELSNIKSKTIVVVGNEALTLEGLVREVGARGLAIVEYPCLELWNAKILRKDVLRKETEVVELASSDAGKKRKRMDEDVSSSHDEAHEAGRATIDVPTTKRLAAAKKPMGILGLSAYASSDDASDNEENESVAPFEETEKDVGLQQTEEAEETGGLASIARAIGWVPAEASNESKASGKGSRTLARQESPHIEDKLDWGDEP